MIITLAAAGWGVATLPNRSEETTAADQGTLSTPSPYPTTPIQVQAATVTPTATPTIAAQTDAGDQEEASPTIGIMGLGDNDGFWIVQHLVFIALG